MERRSFLKTSAAALAAGAFPWQHATGAHRRPNILWLSCEDISPHLGAYGDSHVQTPVLDRFATEGARFDHAFSVSGVCAPSRSCLISGIYPVSLGTHNMRSHRDLPPGVLPFPHYLREAGYYCTNNVKTDYNFAAPDSTWDESSREAHWRNRPSPEQPFFAVMNYTGTHEYQVGRDFEEDDPGRPQRRHDPAALDLPPYFPDTPLVRKHWARYYDLISELDNWIGHMLQELEEDGLAEDTAVFFFSDHGVGTPRAKRWLYDSGIHVPLLVRWPGMLEPGTVRPDPVSFVDFASTVLSIAGAEQPAHLQGRPFLGADKAPPREHIFAARDRMDERYDLIRAVRDTRYKYIRNYLPQRAYDQHLNYPEQWAIMREMRRVHAEGGLDAVQSQFFRQQKPLEELFDTEADPHEVNNLADAPEHQQTLARMRPVLESWMREVEDLGFVPEMELASWLQDRGAGAEAPTYALPESAAIGAAAFGHPLAHWLEELNQREPLRRLHAIRCIGLCGAASLPLLREALRDPAAGVVFWAAQGLVELAADDADSIQALRTALDRPEQTARLAAANALLALGETDTALPPLIAAASEHENEYARLFAVEALETEAHRDEVRAALEKAAESDAQYATRIAEYTLGG